MKSKVRSKICVSLGLQSIAECVEALKEVEMAEVRIDRIRDATPEKIKKLFSSHPDLIATCRPGSLGEEERKKMLLAAIEGGAAFVDVEVDSADAFIEDLRNCAKKKGCTVIVSFHDYKKTPSRAELDELVRWCFEAGADIAKIACMVNNKKDNLRLLGLLDGEKRLVVAGMGKLGRITRVIAPLLGSEFTFASLTEGKETAEGQLAKDRIEKYLEILEKMENE